MPSRNQKPILYLTAIELAFISPLINSQVFGLLSKVKERDIEKKILFLSLFPIRHYFSLQEPFWESVTRYYHRRIDVKKRLRKHGIKVKFIPFLFPFRSKFFYMKLFHLVVFISQAIPLLVCFMLIYRIEIIHARSYPAALLSYLLKKILRTKYIFDMRGLYPEEGVTKGSFNQGSFNYRMWMQIEKKLIENADRVVVESYPFYEYVNSVVGTSKTSVIPCCVDAEKFRYDEKKKIRLKKEYRLEDKFLLVYLGTVSMDGGWHDPGIMADYFLHFKKLQTNTHFLIINNQKKIRDSLSEFLKAKGLEENQFTIINPLEKSTSDILPIGDIGLLLIRKLPKAKTMISVKYVEYLASGLPVIVSSDVCGAANLTRENQCGIVIDLEDRDNFSKEKWLLENYDRVRGNGLKLTENYLSTDKCAKQYIEIYDRLME